jgi:hypothetical protein
MNHAETILGQCSVERRFDMVVRQSEQIMVEAGDRCDVFRFGLARTTDSSGWYVVMKTGISDYLPITHKFKKFSDAYKMYIKNINAILDYDLTNPDAIITSIRMS